MRKNQKYSIDFKLQIVRKYEKGKCGYKRLAREFNLSRDTVREWCLNPKLQDATQMAKKQKLNNDEKDLDYYKTAALFWETYAKNLEEEVEKQGKKKVVLRTMKDCLEKQATTKVRTLCKITGISKSTFYYNRNAKTQEEKDKEILELLHKLPKRILLRRGNKAKSKEIKKRFNKTVNHKKIERICKKYGLLAQNRRRKFPKDYYARQKENQKNLPKNIMNQDFSSDVPLNIISPSFRHKKEKIPNLC